MNKKTFNLHCNFQYLNSFMKGHCFKTLRFLKLSNMNIVNFDLFPDDSIGLVFRLKVLIISERKETRHA